jgi:hypothetical protein
VRRIKDSERKKQDKMENKNERTGSKIVKRAFILLSFFWLGFMLWSVRFWFPRAFPDASTPRAVRVTVPGCEHWPWKRAC